MDLDLDLARFLTSDPGRALLDAARDTRSLPAHHRAGALSGRADGVRVRAALVQDDLRRRAHSRCPHAEILLFTPEALEQATAWPVATDRAARWPAPLEDELVDLGAGVGLDALAAALAGRPVVAVERDPVRAEFLAHNARALGVAERVRVEIADFSHAEDLRLPTRLGFLDPDRRPGGRRTRDPTAYDPPREAWDEVIGNFDTSMLKIGPADASDAPFEVISLDGRARERRLLLGAWPGAAPRRARSLPSGATIDGEGLPWPAARAPEAGLWLLDPDPAVTVAGLVGDLARRHGLSPIHPRIAYLLGEERPPAAVPGRWVKLEAVLGTRPADLRRLLADRGIGKLTLRARGIADDVEVWRRRLRPRGPNAATLVLTRGPDDRWTALLGTEAGNLVALPPPPAARPLE